MVFAGDGEGDGDVPFEGLAEGAGAARRVGLGAGLGEDTGGAACETLGDGVEGIGEADSTGEDVGSKGSLDEGEEGSVVWIASGSPDEIHCATKTPPAAITASVRTPTAGRATKTSRRLIDVSRQYRR